MHRTRLFGVMVVALLICTSPLFGQEESSSSGDDETASPPFALGVGATFGVNSFEDVDNGDIETYQLLALRPDFAIGKFGVGLDLPVNYRFTGGDGSEFEVRREDWVPENDRTFLEIYLPKIRYLRYGQAGEPLYARFGGLSNTTLGSGFIMGNYSNEHYLPDLRIFGGELKIDGQGVGLPYVGFEAMTANVSLWDVVGGRFYVRPLVTTGIPIVSSLQIGTSLVIDRDPFYHLKRDPLSPYGNDYEGTDPAPIDPPDKDVMIWGVDFQQPILNTSVITLALLGDAVYQKDRQGLMTGFTGRLLGFLLYGGQIRVLDAGFIPQYFDNTYDLRRDQRFFVYNGDSSIPGSVGWLGRLGFSLLADALVFDTTVSGSFDPEPGSYPELRSVLTVQEGLIPGFSGLSFQGSYTKFDIRSFDELTDPENAIIGGRFNIRSGPVTISLLYDLTYDPYNPDDPWVITSGLESTISF